MDERFVTSINLKGHPLKKNRSKLRLDYYYVLSHFVRKIENTEYVNARLKQYYDEIVGIKEDINNLEASIHKWTVVSFVGSKMKPWRKKYRYWIMCDIALILMDYEKIRKAADEINKYLSSSQKNHFALFMEILIQGKDNLGFEFTKQFVEQYHKNRYFLNQKEFRIIVTANMSSGKSTLINAIAGKSIARTSQEVCTGNISYIYSKPYEDHYTHLKNEVMNLDATLAELNTINWDKKSDIATCFRTKNSVGKRVCIIDTPGVNYAFNESHGRIAKNALQNEKYDKVIYILNANNLGSDDEISYLKYLVRNVPNEKIVFVMNKLDSFRQADDDVGESINRACQDLLNFGFKSPAIYPLSAYFAFLNKRKNNSELLSEDENDEYQLYKKIFSISKYDFSSFYNSIQIFADDEEEIIMSKRCGLYGLEAILFGGVE